MEDDETLALKQLLSSEAEELLAVYKTAMVRAVLDGRGDDAVDMDELRAAALVETTRNAVAAERKRIAAALMRRSVALDHRRPRRNHPAEAVMEDPLEMGLRGVVPWRTLRYPIARVVYRVMAEMVRRDQV